MGEMIKRVFQSADIVYQNKDYTSATILYFKTLFMVIDHILLKYTGESPKDHTERFRMVENAYPDLYKILDKHFETYRNTYTVIIEKNECDEVKGNVKKVIEKYKIFK